MEASMTKGRSTLSLDERIAAAFSAGSKSDDVPELIGEAEAAAVSAGEAVQHARERALDPALSAEDVAIARHEMADAAFRSDRMQTAVTKLGDRLRELKAQEEDQRRWLAHERAKAERDKLAAELKEVYPAFAVRLADLAARIDANDRETERINTRARPVGAEWLAGAERIARGLKGFNDGTADVPRITRDLRLPGFGYNRHDPYTWPRSR
jgi:hypothetical protein